MKKIIGLQGRAQCGKTSTLNLLIDLLEVETKGCAMPVPYIGDRKKVFVINGLTVGVATPGDTEQIVEENCDFFTANNCDVVFLATRTKGGTHHALDRFAAKQGLTVKYEAKKMESTKGLEPQTNLAQAQELLNMILFK